MDRFSPHSPIAPLPLPPPSLRRGVDYRSESQRDVGSSSSSWTSIGELHYGPWFHGSLDGDPDNASHAHPLPRTMSSTPPPAPPSPRSRGHISRDTNRPLLAVESSMLDLFGQANAEATHPLGASSTNDTADSQLPAAQCSLIPWLVVQDGPPGVKKGLHHGWEGMTGCVVKVFDTRSEAEEALTKLQNTNANTSLSVPVTSPASSELAHSPSKFSSGPSSQAVHTSPPVSASQPTFASQPASQPSSVSQPASASPVADASLPAPSSPTDEAYSPEHASPPNPVSLPIPTSSVGSGSPPASASGARSQSATFNGRIDEDNRHAPIPVDTQRETRSSSPESISLSFSISGDAVGTLIRTISEKILMSVL